MDWYDYGARFYDPALASWTTRDPLQEKYYGMSPYHFSGNNPVNLVDLDGMSFIGAYGMVNHCGSASTYVYDPSAFSVMINGSMKEGVNTINNNNVEPEDPPKDTEVTIAANSGGDDIVNTDDGGDNWAVTAAAGYMMVLQLDIVTPDPTDVAWPKWAGHAVLVTISGIILYSAGKDLADYFAAEHTSGARNSTKGQHQEGQARKARDYGGEKGDVRRNPPRQKPPGWKGPWPPK